MVKAIRFLVPIFIIFLAGEIAFAQGFESINSFKSEITIKSDGTIDVTENILYYFPDSRHGIFREVPLEKVNEDGRRFVVELLDVEVLMDGAAVPFQDNSNLKELNLKIGDPDSTITGSHLYEIRYTLGGALTYFSDHDELYWNTTGDAWPVPIESAGVIVNLETNEPEFFDGICYTGGYGSSAQDCTVTKTSPTSISIKTTHPLGAYEGLTVATRFPSGLVAVLEPKTDNSGLIIIILYLLYAVALPGYLIVRAIKIRKRLPEEKMVVSAWFDPPKTPSKRFLTAGETGTLIDRRVDIRDVSGTLIQLAQKGFIKIREEEKKSGIFIRKPIFTFVKEKDWEGSELMEHEKNLLDIIFLSSNEVSTEKIGKRIGFSSKLNSVMKDIANQLVEDGLFLANVISNRDIWIAIAVLSIFFFNPLLIIAALLNMYAVKRTSAGADAIAKAKSLKNFIVTQDEQYKFQAENKMLFEKLLPYAVAFGVEKVWIERFKDLVTTPPGWYEGSNQAAFNYAVLSNSFNDSLKAATQMSSHRSSSGFSSGFSGGFSGGGGGGGGGGSW